MTIFYFILAAVALGILVFIHELGHYFVAKKMGMTVEVFSIGFGRPILKWKWQNVHWQIGWLPFGGYVKILGMEVSKKDKIEPYDIVGGFFSKSPLKRMAVALAGPFANFILAFMIFCALWLLGGREKSFSDYTQIVGWVDPKSEIYSLGLRPGDTIKTYNDKPFKEAKDLLYAAMLNGEKVTFTGDHIDYLTGSKQAYSYTITPYTMKGSLDDISTTGVSSLAHYLINETPPDMLVSGQPMAGSGIEPLDRLVWADGQLLFSMEQLSSIANSNVALLTIKRADEIFLSRRPRVLISDLVLSTENKGELEDRRYALALTPKLPLLYTIPYTLNNEAVVEKEADFIDPISRQEAFSLYGVDDQPLQPGDRILAVDGTRVNNATEVLSQLQSHRVNIIVERHLSAYEQGSWQEADAVFEASWDVPKIVNLSHQIGLMPEAKEGKYVLLNPVQPKSIFDFALAPEIRQRIEKDLLVQKSKLEEIKDSRKRHTALAALEKNAQRKIFGLTLIDRKICFNPNPMYLFGSVFSETWQTLKALVMGYLHPKWLSGPVGIVQVIHHGWSIGVTEALFWIGAISVNLGFLNLLPIPVLDGGYVCLSLWELITRKRLKARTMERIVIPFVVLLIALLIFLTFQDLIRLF